MVLFVKQAVYFGCRSYWNYEEFLIHYDEMLYFLRKMRNFVRYD